MIPGVLYPPTPSCFLSINLVGNHHNTTVYAAVLNIIATASPSSNAFVFHHHYICMLSYVSVRSFLVVFALKLYSVACACDEVKQYRVSCHFEINHLSTKLRLLLFHNKPVPMKISSLPNYCKRTN